MSELERARAWIAAMALIAVIFFVAVPDAVRWPLLGVALAILVITWGLISFNLARTTRDYPYDPHE